MKEPIRKLDRRRTKPAAKPLRHVVAALILREALEKENSPEDKPTREVFICQRRADQPMALKWEFPGGKIELGETPQGALARELEEELGIDATVGDRIATLRHTYRNGGAIEIQFFRVLKFSGEMQNRIFQTMQWTPLTKLPTFDFLAA
ncbi:MAG TPA: (deoxy)nucleoside triphosphate pyrophosphohydrolase, partial [Bryobacteraceae bacterium]|nr:(deoxy)nucleoside triphosphate pyrophosphohydrolase [Bryobacteraceae bacterium]